MCSHYLGKNKKQGKLEHIEDNGFISKEIDKNKDIEEKKDHGKF